MHVLREDNLAQSRGKVCASKSALQVERPTARWCLKRKPAAVVARQSVFIVNINGTTAAAPALALQALAAWPAAQLGLHFQAALAKTCTPAPERPTLGTIQCVKTLKLHFKLHK